MSVPTRPLVFPLRTALAVPAGTDPQAAGLSHSLTFDGITQDANIASNATLEFAANLTIAGWVKPTDFNPAGSSSGPTPFGKGQSYRLFFFGSTNTIFRCGGDASVATLPPLNQWTHLAGVFDGTNAILYQNGLAIASHSATGPADDGDDFEIGSGLDNQRNYAGSIAAVRLWNRALTPAEVAAAAAGSPPITGLIGEWLLPEGAGTTTRDSSGHPNTLTLRNGTAWSADVPNTTA